MLTADTERLLWTSGARAVALGRATAAGRVHRIRSGVYAPQPWWSELPPHRRYELRVVAAAAMLRDPILALESAAVAHRLGTFGEPRDIHLYDPVATRGYRHGDTVVHTYMTPRAVERVDGVRVTSLIDTAVDLLRVLPLAAAVAVADAALRRGMTKGSLRARLAAQRGTRGVKRAEEAIAFADARSESTLESVSRVLIRGLGYREPAVQYPFVVHGRERRADFFWREERIIGEADGRAKFTGLAHEELEARLLDERHREIALRRQVRNVARWGWHEAMNPRLLDAVLAEAGLVRIRPADPGILAALRHPRR